MALTLIAAISENNVIGRDGKIPWRIPEDMQRFKNLTIGHPVIMGRKTYDSLQEKYKPLPQRENIVVTKDKDFRGYGILVAHSITEAVEMGEQYSPPSYVIGGQQIYSQTIGLAEKLEITKVHMKVEGDAFFPKVNWNDWELSKEEKSVSKTGIEYSFLSYIRKNL